MFVTVRSVKKDEKGYYDELLRYSKEHLMLYPYHLSDFIVSGMRITPFQYYISIMQVNFNLYIIDTFYLSYNFIAYLPLKLFKGSHGTREEL